MRKLLVGLSVALLASATQASTSCFSSWPLWEGVQQTMISPEGRVIDASDARHITTSEGQSYALFFALVNNDKALFRRLVQWTENNLAQGDLTAHLPAWLWGRTSNNSWDVLDSNTASDSNLWIAYSLLEAGRLWKARHYTVLGHLLLQRMATEELVDLPEFGYALLPGKVGFTHTEPERWQLNPSYVPPQLVQRAQQELSDSHWSELAEKTPAFLIQTAPLGIAPDWVSWRENSWSFIEAAEQVGSYDAIRVYLWVGMLADEAASTAQLKAHFRLALPFINQENLPAEKLQVLDGQASGTGPVGFSAALLPLFGNTDFGQKQRERIENTNLTQLGYYNQMLVLFGQGWDEKRYAFDAQGQLIPRWVDCK